MNNDLNHRDSTEIIGHTDIPETSVIKARTSKPQINNDYSDDNSTIKPQKLNIIEKLFIVLLIIVPLSLLQFGSGGFEKIKNKISDLQAETKEPISSTSKPKTDTFSLDDKGMKQYLDNHKLYGLDEDNFELNYGSVYEDEKHSNQHPEIILRYSEKDSKKRVKISQSDSKNDYPIGFINCPGYPEYTNTISAKQFLVSAIDLTKDTCIKIDNSEDYIYIYRKYDGATTTEILTSRYFGNVVTIVSTDIALNSNGIPNIDNQAILNLAEELRMNIVTITQEKLTQTETY